MKMKLRWSGDEYVCKNVSGVSGLVKQQQPGGIGCHTTVQVGGVLLLTNVQGFQYPSLPIVPFHISCLGGLPVHLVLVGSSMGCHPIVGVMFLTTFLCSRRHFSRVLLVYPMYTHSQSLHGIRDRQHRSSSCLLGAASLVLGHFWGSFWTCRPYSLPLELGMPFRSKSPSMCR